MAEIYISTDVETDGPIPGPHSMLSFASAAYLPDKTLVSTFSANLETLPGAQGDPKTMDWWQTQPDAWQACRADLQSPASALPKYVAWIKSLKGKPVFVAYPAGFDFMFVYWYLIRFAGESPFSHSALDLKTLAMAVMKCPYRDATKRNMPKSWFDPLPHSHVALDDAIEQGALFCNMLAALNCAVSYDPQDTIAAVASAEGGAARGIVRISGPQTVAVLAGCFEADSHASLMTHARPACLAGQFRLEQLADRPPRSVALPADLYLWPGVRSYTREPLAEIHTIGSPPLLGAVMDTLVRRGVRPAEPGEFTLRAFLAGRIDLTQAEAVLGVIDSRDARELDVALTQLAGGLKGRLSELRERLLDLLTRLEAGLDFVEEDIEFISRAELMGELQAARDRVSELAGQVVAREHSSPSIRVVLAGPPNAGKSSLFNALAARAGKRHGVELAGSAIVSDVPGTTRDWLVAPLVLDGLECQLIDTAGDENPRDAIAAQAQEHRSEQVSGAHLTLECRDATHFADGPASTVGEQRLTVWTKCDAVGFQNLQAREGIYTSAMTGQGLDELLGAIRSLAAGVQRSAEGVVAATAVRSASSIRLAGEALQRAMQCKIPGEEELVAAEVRGALAQIGQVVGAVYTDDILDRIFSRFCIGK